MSAYFRRHPQAETKYVDEFLVKRAVSQVKKINFEFSSGAVFTEDMAQMSTDAQSQYISWLLSYLDDQDKGLNDQSPFDWEIGHPPRMTASLARMIQMPALYEVLQERRNEWWSRKIAELLNTGGRSFVAIGLLHLIGPASIPDKRASLECQSRTYRLMSIFGVLSLVQASLAPLSRSTA